jgi:squalene-hopene/tetraprenyl-beta-curcumene cyclase
MEHPVTSTLSDVDRDQLIHAAHAALGALRSLQKADGHWCAELEGDSILQSEYLLMKFILGQERQPMADGRDGWQTLTKIAAYLRMQQREDGGWGQYPGSGVDISATVKGYFALKLMGDDPDAPHMTAAREMIIAMGGAEQCNSFTKFYLACLGQISWRAVPAIPPEIVYLPRWFYFHMTKVSAWTRTMILPLSLVVTLRPQREVPRELGIDELYVSRRDRHRLMGKADSPAFWKGFFHAVDAALKLAHRIGGTPARRLAIRRAEQWILKRAGQDGIACTEGIGAIFPPMVYLQVALKALGYERNHPVIQQAERDLDAFFYELPDRDAIDILPCFSPVWDTGIALYALTEAGLDESDDRIRRTTEWLVSKECRHRGDWAENARYAVEPSGWYFEFNNQWYPDVDDTAMVAMALHRAGSTDGIDAAKRGLEWLLALQNDDGGWAAFDRTKDRPLDGEGAVRGPQRDAGSIVCRHHRSDTRGALPTRLRA